MDPEQESLLVSTCSALGGFEHVSEDWDDDTEVYVMGDECLECMKDIKKFIKFFGDHPDNPALTFLAKMGILENDLVPIMLLNSPADNEVKERLVLACIELIVPMTWIIDFKELQDEAMKHEDDSIVGNLHQKTEILRGYKLACIQPRVMEAVLGVLMRPLNVEYRLRTTRDQAIIRLGLSLFRNLVAIQDAESSITGSMGQFVSSIMQDTLLERFQEETVMTLLLVLASSSTEPQYVEWNAITLEIFYHIFSGVDPAELIPSVSGGTANTRLQDLLAKEERERASISTAGRKRHDRFGTTGSVKLKDGTTLVLHKKGALFTDFEQQLDDIKKPRAKKKYQKETGEYRKNLSKSGISRLRNLASTMLESCYNPFFGTLRKDIEHGREKIKGHHKKQYLFLMSFMLKFQRMYVDYLNRQHAEKKKSLPPHRLEALEKAHEKDLYEYGFHLVATSMEVTCVFQIITNIRQSQEAKEWDDVRIGVNCLQELLSTLYVMSKSGNQELMDASDHVQINLYYEEATLELFVDLAKNYKLQSKKYLHTLLKMIHVLLKSLESYSKQKPDLIVRKVVAARRKKDTNKGAAGGVEGAEGAEGAEGSQVDDVQQSDNTPQPDGETQPDNQDQNDSEDEDNSEKKRISRERKFLFQEFERRFANEHVVATYCTFLEDFATLDESQLHLAASMFHRIALSCKNMGVFYKMSTLHLFHQILLKGNEGTKKDLEPFVNYVLHQFFKKLQEYPLLMAETFFPRSRQACLDINVGRDALEMEDRAQEQKKEKRLMNIELQVDPGRSESEQIQIAVMGLLDEDKEDLVLWIIDILGEAVVKRMTMTVRTEQELEEDPDLMYSVEGVEDIPIEAVTPARQKSLRVEPRFRLLLKLLSFTKTESFDGSLQYSIPKTISTETLHDYQELIQEVVDKETRGERDLDLDLATLITKINKTKAPSGGTRRRVAVNGNDREPEKAPLYHSAEYVIDSEDDEDIYFDKEKRLRERTSTKFTEEQNERMKQAVAMEAEKKRLHSLRNGGSAALAILSRLEKSGELEHDDDQGADDQDKRRKRAVSLDEDDSDDGEQDDDEDKENMRPKPKSASDIESDDDAPTQRRISMGSSEATKSLSEKLASSTIASPTKKRRAILLDSDEDEESDEGDGKVSDGAGPTASRTKVDQEPARKKVVREDHYDEVSSDDGSQATFDDDELDGFSESDGSSESDGFSGEYQHWTTRWFGRRPKPTFDDDDTDGLSHGSQAILDDDDSVELSDASQAILDDDDSGELSDASRFVASLGPRRPLPSF